MTIFLTGFMGCGKSTIGKKLATKLGYNFIDLDKVIEQNTGGSIDAYFRDFGENSFRELERDTLQNTVFPQDSVVATGGGLPCFFDNMEWMNANGTTIYISMPVYALVNRLVAAKDERPVLKGVEASDLPNFITGKLAEREPFYQRANLILNGLELNAEKIVQYLNMSSYRR